jgi:hypothetical protein
VSQRRYPRTAILVAILAGSVQVRDAAGAQVPAPTIPRVVIEDDDLSALRALDAAGTLSYPIAVRIGGSLSVSDALLETRLAMYRARQVPIWLAVAAPASVDDAGRWQSALRGLLDRHRAGMTILEVTFDKQSPQAAAFAVRVAATEARSGNEKILIAAGGPRMADTAGAAEIFTPDLAPYLDLLATPDGTEAGALTWLKKVDPDAGLVLTGGALAEDSREARHRLMDGVLRHLGTDVRAEAWRPAAGLPSALQGLTPLAALMNGEISILDPDAAALHLTLDGRAVERELQHRLLFDNRTFATYLVYWGDAAAGLLHVSLTLAVEGRPGARELESGARLEVTGYSRDSATGRAEANIPLTDGRVLVDFNEGAAKTFIQRTDVSAERSLTIAEIVANHQRQQRAQDAAVHNYLAHARMEQHFRPTIADPGYDVVTENVYFVDDDGVEWEERSFSVNGSKWGADRPPLPLLQPEKVLSLPLQLRFDDGYRYQLSGRERVDGYDCFVVKFEPVRSEAALYRGTVWIDRKTFARIRVHALQGGLAAPVVSNEEVQRYTNVTSVEGRPIFLFSGLTARQIVLIAGRNLLVEKSVDFSDFRVNAPDFARERATARAGDAVMYRETESGLRYYMKEGDRRVISLRPTKSIKALAFGVTLDPSFAFPLPIFGINYLNFEFGDANTQLAVLFGGVLAAVNLQRPKLGSTPFDASFDLFAIAVPSTDRVYDASVERKGESVLNWPLTAGLNLGWQYTPFQKVSLQPQFRFDGYARDTTTSDRFAVPRSTVTTGIGGAWEFKKGGYNFGVNGASFRRLGWADWGADPVEGSAFSGLSTDREYEKYSASISRDFYYKVFHKVHLNGAWFGGRHLDRFEKYQFGLFDDTKIHGVPASGVRFDDLAMVRGSYSWNVFEQYRLDLFLERGWGRDLAFDAARHPITGLGTAVNFRGPWSTIVRAELGKSALPARYQGLGSTTLQILVLKPRR